MYHRIGALNPIYLEEWMIVRNYQEFIQAVEANYETITHISFDHDLGADMAKLLVFMGWSKKKARAAKIGIKNGYDCAKWTKEFYARKKRELPIMFVHSMNPVGTENIINLFK